MKNLNATLITVANNGVVRFPFIEKESIRNVPVDNLNLDTRSSNALQRHQIKTIGELLDNIEKLNNIRGLGSKSKSNILYNLCAFQYNQLNAEKKIEYLYRITEMNTEGR